MRRYVAVGLAALGLGCAPDGGTGPGEVRALTLRILPDSAVQSGLSSQVPAFTAQLRHPDGRITNLADSAVVWTTSAGTDIFFDQADGGWYVFSERYFDRVVVRADFAGLVDSAVLTVSAGPTSHISAMWVVPDSLYLAPADSARFIVATVRRGLPSSQTYVEPMDSLRVSAAGVAAVFGDTAYWVRGLSAGLVEARAHRGSAFGAARVEVVAPSPPAPSMRLITASERGACAVPVVGDVHCWPSDYTGQAPGPIGTVPGSAGLVQISGGRHRYCGVRTDGVGVCWGYNDGWSFGTETGADLATPTPIGGALRFRRIVLADQRSCGLLVDSTAVCWGNNTAGQLGDGTTESRTTPAPISGGGKYLDLHIGRTTACGLRADSTAVCWGFEWSGELGNGGASHSYVPGPVAGGHKAIAMAQGLSHGCLLDADGAAWCWGRNTSGELGSGTLTAADVPVPVIGGHRFVAIGAGADFTCARTVDGRIYCWGRPIDGRAFPFPADPLLQPTLISGALSFTDLHVGVTQACGLTADGGAWCWGANDGGALGDGTTASRWTPARVRAPD